MMKQVIGTPFSNSLSTMAVVSLNSDGPVIAMSSAPVMPAAMLSTTLTFGSAALTLAKALTRVCSRRYSALPVISRIRPKGLATYVRIVHLRGAVSDPPQGRDHK